MDELEAMKSHVELAAGHLLQALKCAAKLAESQPTAPNTTKVAICEDCKKPCGNLVAITDRHNYHDGYYCPTCIASME